MGMDGVRDKAAVTAFWSIFFLSPQPRLFRIVLILYFVFLVLLPSGSIFGVNVKLITFIVLVPLALHLGLLTRQLTRNRVLLLLAVPTFLLLWMFVAQSYGFDADQSFAQSKDISVTIATCAFALLICRDDFDTSLWMLRSIVWIETATSAIKVALLLYAFARGIPVSQIIDTINAIFGVQLMPFDIESLFGRLQFISDNLIPVCIFAVLMYRERLRLRPVAALLILFVLVVSDLFTFSRYLFVFAALTVLLGLLLGKKDRFQLALIGVLTAVVLVSLPVLSQVVLLRFSSDVTSSSDAERTQQLNALGTFILDAPWFGHGLGSYTTRSIRSETALYSYEAQLQALVGQIGAVGVVLLGSLTALYYRRLWPTGNTQRLRVLGLCILLLAWLGGGFLNPSVISSAAAVSYVAMYAMGNLEALSPRQGAAQAI